MKVNTYECMYLNISSVSSSNSMSVCLSYFYKDSQNVCPCYKKYWNNSLLLSPSLYNSFNECMHVCLKGFLFIFSIFCEKNFCLVISKILRHFLNFSNFFHSFCYVSVCMNDLFRLKNIYKSSQSICHTLILYKIYEKY